MKTCPYCKEEVRDDATKCRHCHSSLKLTEPTASDPSEERRITYIVDKDLIRFAKFATAVLALFLIVGGYLFGFKLEASVERVNSLQREAEKTSEELKKSQAELQGAKSTLQTLKADVETVLRQAKGTLEEISKQRDVAVAMVVSIRELDPAQEQKLVQIKSTESKKTRGSGKLWETGATIRVAFQGGSAEQRAMVQRVAVEWLKYANLTFKFTIEGDSDVRIAFDPSGGSWSFLGTDALAVPGKESTMNLGWTTRENILHEFGHVLGLVEEHQNPKANIKWDIQKVMKSLKAAPNFWSDAEIQDKVFRKFPREQLGDYRDFDPRSIMTFGFPPDYTGGVAIGGATDLSESDKRLVQRLYPKR